MNNEAQPTIAAGLCRLPAARWPRLYIVQHLLLGFGIVFASFASLSGTPTKSAAGPGVIQVKDIDPESAHVSTSRGEPGAQLRFLFRAKDPTQARRIFFGSKERRVRIMDRNSVIIDTKLTGIISHQTKKSENKGGLVLSFDTLEEANRAAVALHPFLK
ncbi:MAG TPA: hypothetical protein VN887_16535 [Candidatus Angelobacter sp.]|nr:hypothetical protein [Candidatus Angelobacter sp.]